MKTSPPAAVRTLPGWATPHNLVVIAVAAGAVLLIFMLASAVRRLSRHAPAPAAPPPAPKKSSGGVKLLLAGAAVVGGWFLFGRHQNAAVPVKATPAPSPTPTVTQTVAPHVTSVQHLPLTGNQILIGLAVLAVVAIVITRLVVRNLP